MFESETKVEGDVRGTTPYLDIAYRNREVAMSQKNDG